MPLISERPDLSMSCSRTASVSDRTVTDLELRGMTCASCVNRIERFRRPMVRKGQDSRDLLAVLCGKYPSEAPEEKFSLSTLKLPEDLPLSLPSELVAQRPDHL